MKRMLVMCAVLALGLLSARAGAAEDLRETVGKINAFGVQIYSRLAQTEGNVAFSSYNIARALLMVASGAQGESAKEIYFSLGLSPESLRLMPTLAGSLYDPQNIRLQIASSMWIDEGFKLKQPFSAGMQEYFNATAELAPFSTDPGKARELVNFWVEQNTGGMIREVLPDGSVTTLTRLVLCDTIFFKALWEMPFEVEETKVEEFQTPGGAVKVNMMRQTLKDAQYQKGADYHALRLPYAGGRYAMILVQPLAGTNLRPCELVWGEHGQWFSGWSQQVELSMPRFTADSSQSIKRTLQQLGIGDIFTDKADLSLISDADLLVSDVFHSCKVEVEESGTKAAAATAAVVGLWAEAPQAAVNFTLDRPFMYLIREERTGLVLFAGRVVTLPDVTPKEESKAPDITESGYGPWRFGMSREQVGAALEAGPYRPDREGGLQTKNAPWKEFFDRRADLTFDGMDQLVAVRVWLCSDATEAVAKEYAAKVEAFVAPLTLGQEKGLAAEVFAELDKLDAGRPQIASKDIATGPGKPRIRLSVMRHPELGYFVYLTYSAL